ncbi:MAG: hypothetical protein ACE5OR_02685 [bacterium]
MPYKRITVVDLYHLLRRWHDGQTVSEISPAMELNRKTIRSYLATDTTSIRKFETASKRD